MSEVYVFGHKNPDTDSICASIAYAEFKQTQGVNAKPVRLGKLNPETKFVLDRFNVEEPEEMHDFEGEDVILVDHTIEEESGENIKKAHILEIIDHHPLGNIQTLEQVFARIEPIGSTSTIICKIYKESNVEIDDKIAGLLLSGILSDTVVLRSVTCTEQDKKIANELADQLDLDIGKYGFELKKSKSDISKKTDKELIESDLKKYSSLNIAIGQLEVVEDTGKRKESIIKEMENMRKKMKLDTILMMITDILKQDTELLVAGKADLVEKAFKTKVKNNSIYLKGVMSRKKQVSSVLERAAL